MIPLFFDALIIVFLLSVGSFLIYAIRRRDAFNENKLVKSVLIYLFIAWITVFYGSFIEPQHIAVRNYEVLLGDSSRDNIKAVVLSDLHLGPYRNDKWIERIVKAVNELNPDIVFMLGDYVYDSSDQIQGLSPILGIDAKHGIIAITGNHDYKTGDIDLIVDTMESFGIRFLRNNSEVIELGEGKLRIAGVDDLWYESNSSTALRDSEFEETVILLGHNPDIIRSVEDTDVDIVISGHTHGGQIRLPIIGSVAVLPTYLGRDYDKGLFNYGGKSLFITPGIGESGPRARLFNPPEISVLNLSY